MDNIVPSGVLFKDSGLWMFYKSDDDFSEGREMATQGASETFHEFIERVVKSLMELEAVSNIPIPYVTIDYAIYSKEQYNNK